MGGKHYTDDDIKYIRENIDRLAYRVIAANLGRTITSVIQLCRRENIVKSVRAGRDHDYDASRHPNCYSTAQRQWIIENAPLFYSRDKFHIEFMKTFNRETTYTSFRDIMIRLKAHLKNDVVRHTWTEEDIEFLRKNIDVMSNSEIGAIFGISASGVSHTCRRFGIKKKLYKKDGKLHYLKAWYDGT